MFVTRIVYVSLTKRYSGGGGEKIWDTVENYPSDSKDVR